MFDNMTEQQAREEILKLTAEYCKKYHTKKEQQTLSWATMHQLVWPWKEYCIKYKESSV